MSSKRDAVIAELPKLRRYATALIGDSARADDLVQDTVERALSRLQLWKSGSNMRGWLFMDCHRLLNECLTVVRGKFLFEITRF